LGRFVYGGDEARLKYDLENLRAQGLVEEKTLFRAHRSARKLVTLTAEGERLVRKASGLPQDQRIYHGFVKPRSSITTLTFIRSIRKLRRRFVRKTEN